MNIELDFLKQLDRFQLAMKKKVHSQYQGSRETKQFGQGLVFKDFREYVPGDDFRFIDWKVYARTDKFYIRRFEEERNMVVHVLVDSSGSMKYGTGNHTKFEYASMVGLGFSYMAMKNNEKFNFITFSDDVQFFRPRKGMDQLLSIVDYLKSIKADGKSEFRKCMETYKKSITSRSLIVLVSDFLYPVEELEEVLQRYKRSEVVVVQVLDPTEVDMRVEGDVILEDAELKTKLRTFISKRLIKKYSDKLEEHRAKLKDICEDTDSSFISVTTDTPVFEIFYRVLSNRN